ncbi:MAG: hypothetical protein ACYTAN_16440 [Planctomycetota bacterium]|jgi:hypothetical protein
MLKRIEIAIGILLLLAIAAVGYRLALSKVELDIYRDRLAGLSDDYEALRSMYNQAVARTAVTELIVKDGRLSVAIRTIEGVDRVIDTQFDPAREIYCDYVLLNGRLWIRRVYDARTPPEKGLVIDDELQRVDWNDPAARYGKAVYRSLDEGRWIVTVTGDGSLGLARTDGRSEVTLSGPPPVRDYEQLKKQIDDKLSDVTIGDVLRRLLASGK